MASAVDVNDSFIVAGCDNAVIGVWDATDASEINLLSGKSLTQITTLRNHFIPEFVKGWISLELDMNFADICKTCT